MSNDDNEVLQRVRRIETKVMVLGNAMGVDMKQERERATVQEQAIVLTHLDVPLSSLLQMAASAHLLNPCIVKYNGHAVALLYGR